MRGKLVFDDVGKNVVGITPADAGKTARIRDKCTRRQDHPRGCGENVNKFSADF